MHSCSINYIMLVNIFYTKRKIQVTFNSWVKDWIVETNAFFSFWKSTLLICNNCSPFSYIFLNKKVVHMLFRIFGVLNLSYSSRFLSIMFEFYSFNIFLKFENCVFLHIVVVLTIFLMYKFDKVTKLKKIIN